MKLSRPHESHSVHTIAYKNGKLQNYYLTWMDEELSFNKYKQKWCHVTSSGPRSIMLSLPFSLDEVLPAVIKAVQLRNLNRTIAPAAINIHLEVRMVLHSNQSTIQNAKYSTYVHPFYTKLI